MKRLFSLFSVFLPLLLPACGKPEVAVHAELVEQGTGQRAAIAELPVRLLPYDRDAVIDSLVEAAGEPEPQVPADLQQQRDSLERARSAWGELDARMRALGDSLTALSARMARTGAGAPTPAERDRLAREIGRVDQEREEVKRRLTAFSAELAVLQRRTEARLDSVQTAREAWAKRVLVDFDEVVRERLEGLERTEAVDTTDQAGDATFQVDPGRWWVYARYALPGVELYWNLPLEISEQGGRIRLDESNAQRRPIF